jgi:hypothetical protein
MGGSSARRIRRAEEGQFPPSGGLEFGTLIVMLKSTIAHSHLKK